MLLSCSLDPVNGSNMYHTLDMNLPALRTLHTILLQKYIDQTVFICDLKMNYISNLRTEVLKILASNGFADINKNKQPVLTNWLHQLPAFGGHDVHRLTID